MEASPKCGKRFVTLKKTVEKTTTLLSFPLKCKSWNCPRCADKKSLFYGKVISQWFVNKQLYFYTLTFYHSVEPVAAWQNASDAWNNLNIALHKKYGRFSYVKVLECHKESNYPHYHILSDKLFNASIFGEMALAAGFGYQIRIQRVQSSGVSGYIRKYLGKSWPRKDSAQIRTDLRLRVFTHSTDLHTVLQRNNTWKLLRICTDHSEALRFMLAHHYAMTLSTVSTTGTFEKGVCPMLCFEVPASRFEKYKLQNPENWQPRRIHPKNTDDAFDYGPWDPEVAKAYLPRNPPCAKSGSTT